jgi:tetratricopeptide (TPR) repeat protein
MAVPLLVSARLARLAHEADRLTNLRLWKALTIEAREAAAMAFLGSGSAGAARKVAITIVASERHFRPQTVATWPNEKIAAAIAKVDLRDPDWAWSAIVEHHVTNRLEMLSAFLEAVNIPHALGRIKVDLPAKPLAPGLVLGAADALLEKYPAEDVVVYLLALRLMDGTAFAHLPEWFKLHFQSGSSVEAGVVVLAQPEQPDPRTVAAGVIGFTTLDLRLTRIIVDAVADIVGAPSRDEVDDMLEELQKLSSSRHQTFFHCGFRDALFDRDPATELAAENAPRRRWYFSGYIAGVARSAKFGAIGQLFDNRPRVREIFDVADGASASAGWLIFRALCEQSRYPEAAALARREVVAISREFRQELLLTATDLIRQTRATDARVILDKLWLARPNEPDDDDSNFWLSVRRRRALCLRQLGESEEARLVLEELAKDPDLATRAVALTDLGLIRAGVRRLGELTLPKEKAERSTFVESLERGEEFFLKAIESPHFQPAHAQFALGVLAFLREVYSEAVKRIDSALSFFAQSPDVYRRDGTLPLAELYLGIALCQSMEDAGRLARASELIQSGLSGGSRVPHWLIRSTIDTLSLGRADLVDAPATALLASDDSALDELVESAAGNSAIAITSALFARAALVTRPAPKRVVDYQRVLPALLRGGSIDRAADGLAYLEEQAVAGMHTKEILEFLQAPDNYSPAWSHERAKEARARILESEGRFVEAADLLERLVYQFLSQDEEYALDRAELIVGHLEEYGADFSPLAELLALRVDGKRIATDISEEDLDALPRDLDLRILVVGGNELQSRMDQGIIERVHEKFRKVEVEFLHTGWKGNWVRYAEEFDRRVGRVDGVVMLSLMRTNLGITVRQNCPVPWRGCRGRGRGEISQAIEHVLPFALRWKQRTEVAVAGA